MSHENHENYQDIENLAQEGHLPTGSQLRIRIDGEYYLIDDPIVTGRQLLNLADRNPVEEHLIYYLTPAGVLEDLSLEEKIDLRTHGVERFLTFNSDRSFRFELDSTRQDWGAPQITEPTLRKLAGVPDNYRVWLERRGTEDELLKPGQSVPLTGAGVERFYTGTDATTAGSVPQALPEADTRYLRDHQLSFTLVQHGNQAGVIFENYPIPSGALDMSQADLLVLLPPGYPDNGPDMFYLHPWVRMAQSGNWPERADQAFQFGDRDWQRWSRHNNVWRPGVDGIWTVLRRVDAALRAVPCAA